MLVQYIFAIIYLFTECQLCTSFHWPALLGAFRWPSLSQLTCLIIIYLSWKHIWRPGRLISDSSQIKSLIHILCVAFIVCDFYYFLKDYLVLAFLKRPALTPLANYNVTASQL